MGAFDDLIPKEKDNAFADLIPQGKSTSTKRQAPVSMPYFMGQSYVTPPTEEDRAAGTHLATAPLRFAVGAGKQTAGLGQTLSRLNMLPTDPRGWDALVDSAARAEQILSPNGEMNIAGTAGETLSPANLAVTRLMGPANSVFGKMRQGAAFGGMFGASQPVTSDKNYGEEKARQVATGTILGGLIPGGIEASKYVGRSVKDIVDVVMARVSPDARAKLAEKLAGLNLKEIVGEKNLPRIADELERRLKASPVIPNYKPTTAELLADVPEASPILALQMGTGKTLGGVSAQFGQRIKEQDDALRAAIRSIGGTPQELRAAEMLAQARARENYGPLMGQRVSLASDTALMGDDIARARGVPINMPQSGNLPGGGLPYTGRAGALQQQGIMQTEAAQQANFANNWFPVPGMPRTPGRYSHNIERVPEAQAGARTAGFAAEKQGQVADFLERSMDVFKDRGMLATESAAPLMQRPSMQNAIQYAQRLAAERGYQFPRSLDDQFSVQNLHDIKLGLDAQIRAGANKNAPTALDNTTLDAIGSTKSQFLKWFETKVPGYGSARVEFSKDMTRPNQMRVAQALEDKLLNPQGQMTPGGFLRAIDDEQKTIRNALGQPRQDFASIFNPRQRETIDAVGGLLENRLLAKNPTQPTVIGGQNIAEQGILSLPNMLYRPTMVANWMLGKLKERGGAIEKSIDELNAFRLLNPDKFAEAIRAMQPKEANQIYKILGMSSDMRQRALMNQGLLSPALLGFDEASR